MTARLERLRWRVPEWWVWIAVAPAWIFLVGRALAPATQGEHAGHLHQAVPVTASRHEFLEFVCVVAMMVPLIAPTLRRAARASLWRRRDRAMAACLAGYLLIWFAATLLVGTLIDALAVFPGHSVMVGFTVMVALLWQTTRAKGQALRGCHLMLPLAPVGWRADADCFRLGLAVGVNCVITCLPVMALVAATGHHPVAVLIAFGCLATERFGRHVVRDAVQAIIEDLRFTIGAGAQRA